MADQLADRTSIRQKEDQEPKATQDSASWQGENGASVKTQPAKIKIAPFHRPEKWHLGFEFAKQSEMLVQEATCESVYPLQQKKS